MTVIHLWTEMDKCLMIDMYMQGVDDCREGLPALSGHIEYQRGYGDTYAAAEMMDHDDFEFYYEEEK